MKLNTNKTELMVRDLLLDVHGCSISPFMVRNLGVILDSMLSFQSHVKSITKNSFLSSEKHLQTPTLPLWTCGWDPHPCLHHLPPGLLQWSPVRAPFQKLDRLQYVQNSAARVLTRTKPWQHITPTLICLHWLPVKSCIPYKISPFAHPQYLSNLPTRFLRFGHFCLTSLKNHLMTTSNDLWRLAHLLISCHTSARVRVSFPS